MAGFWFLLGFWALVDPGTALPQMRANVEQALAIDQSVPEGHALRGVLYGLEEWNWAAAEREVKLAIEINPASLYVLRPTGRIQEAIREMQYCLELNPLSTPVHVHLGFLFHQNREFDRGIEFCRKALELEPNYHLARD
jgi:lipoprotein NlpI